MDNDLIIIIERKMADGSDSLVNLLASQVQDLFLS